MRNIKKDFSKYRLKTYMSEKGKRYLDPIRNMFVQITPEEKVRQKMIRYMQKAMGIPVENIGIEEHLSHYGVDSYNGRMDIVVYYLNGKGRAKVLLVVECKEENVFIESMQVKEQAQNYSRLVNAKYFCLVNGQNIQFYHKHSKEKYVPIVGIPSFSQMKKDVFFSTQPQGSSFRRLSYEKYFHISYLEKRSWYEDIIGEDTPRDFVPFIVALNDCLLDTSQTLKKLACSRFSIVDDLGVQFRQYKDASGSNFGSGSYRLFLVNDNKRKQQFLCGVLISTVGKTFNDPHFGTLDGKSVLVLIYNNGNVDELAVQINLNKFLDVDKKKRIAHLFHNGSTRRKGASKIEFLKLVKRRNKDLVADDTIELGMIDYSKPLYFKNNDMRKLISNLIEYSVYRNEYKAVLSKRKD